MLQRTIIAFGSSSGNGIEIGKVLDALEKSYLYIVNFEDLNRVACILFAHDEFDVTFSVDDYLRRVVVHRERRSDVEVMSNKGMKKERFL